MVEIPFLYKALALGDKLLAATVDSRAKEGYERSILGRLI